MPTALTDTQRADLLRFVSRHSPQGEAFCLDELPGDTQDMFGFDLGFGLLTLACEGLCGVEEPDLVWSTPKGLATAAPFSGSEIRKPGGLRSERGLEAGLGFKGRGRPRLPR